jgi:hypothetical protein
VRDPFPWPTTDRSSEKLSSSEIAKPLESTGHRLSVQIFRRIFLPFDAEDFPLEYMTNELIE